MSRPVTLFTGQWADLPLETMAERAADMGFDGLELACWGDHFDVASAARDKAYCDHQRAILDRHGLACFAISNHLVGQAVCDRIDPRHEVILPPHVWGDGEPESVRRRAAEEMKLTARAAANFGVSVVNGFTGSSIWGDFYFFPPTEPSHVDAGYRDFADRWGPILDTFDQYGVRFALEVHPSEIAYDIYSTRRALEAIDEHDAFGFNFDPSHLLWQGIDPARFIQQFGSRIFHCHMKDVAIELDVDGGILGSHLPFGDPRRRWDFRSVGRGDIDFESVIRALNRIGYDGPLSVEWEDAGMDREFGARESCSFVRQLDFVAGTAAFDDSFARD